MLRRVLTIAVACSVGSLAGCSGEGASGQGGSGGDSATGTGSTSSGGGASPTCDPRGCLLGAECPALSCDASCRPPLSLYLLAGQSNMVGLGSAALLPAELVAPRCDIPIKAEGLNTSPQLAGRWLPLGPGFGADAPLSRIGPELSFGHAMKAARPERQLALFKSAVGATGLACQWGPDAPSDPACTAEPTGPLYAGFIASTQLAVAELQNNWDVTIAGLLWMQGESDTAPPTIANAYLENLRRFVSQLRIDLGTPALPVVIAKIARQPWLGCGGQPDIVRAAQDQLAAEDPLVATVEADDLSKLAPVPTDCVVPTGADPFHYDTAGLVTLGERFAGAVLAIESR